MIQSGLLDKKKQFIVYCNSGGRSYNAYRKLMKLGYTSIRQAILQAGKKTACRSIPQENKAPFDGILPVAEYN